VLQLTLQLVTWSFCIGLVPTNFQLAAQLPPMKWGDEVRCVAAALWETWTRVTRWWRNSVIPSVCHGVDQSTQHATLELC